MEAMKFRTRVGQDGILQLEMPDELWGQEVEAILVLRALKEIETNSLGWPVGFFERTYGAFADNPMERGDQGEHEIRDEIE
ncbi:MAG: hypothetical protein K8L91_07795 [Anaerolineae bacterium]|nr:hypothetical protein [Anaerolineae bacterium]